MLFKNKSQLITIGLLTLTLVLVVAIIYLSRVITSESDTGETQNLTTQKIKAANVTYNKTIALASPSPSPTLTPLVSVLPTVTVTAGVSPTLSILVSPTVNNLLAYNNEASISPTEIILAYNNEPTQELESSSLSGTVVKTNTLPASGFINNAIIMFTVAGLLIFFSFMF